MASVQVYYTAGGHTSVDCCSMLCPSCGALISPVYLAMHPGGALFCQCPVHDCKSLFLIKIIKGVPYVLPNHDLSKKVFSETIQSVSTSFVTIYNEAYAAEQMSLNEICGVGYRKALEFLIKDYACKDKCDEEVNAIRANKLSKCIEDYVTDLRIKAVAKRAVWLGNDETHYVRKWEGKDVHDLKCIIDLVIRWIEQEIETASLLKDMPEQ